MERVLVGIFTRSNLKFIQSFGPSGANNLPAVCGSDGGKRLIMSDLPAPVLANFDCPGVSEFTLWATLIMCLIVLR